MSSIFMFRNRFLLRCFFIFKSSISSSHSVFSRYPLTSLDFLYDDMGPSSRFLPRPIGPHSEYLKSFTLGFFPRVLSPRSALFPRALHLRNTDFFLEPIVAFKNSLGLTLSPFSLMDRARLTGKTLNMFRDRLLLEILVFNADFFGRFFVLVQLGVGCTVWYCFAPLAETSLPQFSYVLREFDSFMYRPEQIDLPGFTKQTYVFENENINVKLAEACRETYPFTELNVPARGATLMAVTIGLTIAIFICLGIPPEAVSVEQTVA